VIGNVHIHHERYDYKLKPVSLFGLVCALSRRVTVINQPLVHAAVNQHAEPTLLLRCAPPPCCSGWRHRKQRGRSPIGPMGPM